MKTWVKERIVHVALLVLAALVQLNGKWSAILAGDWEALKALIATGLMIIGFSAFQGVASATDRRGEKMLYLGRKYVSIDCELSILNNLWLGRAAFALVGLVLSGWVSVVNVVWDAVIYPRWRLWYRARYPYQGEDATREDSELEDLLVHLMEMGQEHGLTLYNILYRNAGWGVQWFDVKKEPADAPGGAGGLVVHAYRDTLREAIVSELHRLTLKTVGRELAAVARSAE